MILDQLSCPQNTRETLSLLLKIIHYTNINEAQIHRLYSQYWEGISSI